MHLPLCYVCAQVSNTASNTSTNTIANTISNPSAYTIAYTVSNASAYTCLLYTSPSPRDGLLSRMPSSA